MKTDDLPRDTAPMAFTLDGQLQEARPGETLLQVARRAGIELPHLCHSERLGSPGNCRACVVEIEGERVLAPSCCRTPQAGMVVKTASERATSARKTVLELLLSDAPHTADLRHDSELAHWAKKADAQPGRYPARPPAAQDLSHVAMSVNLDASAPAATCRAMTCWAWPSVAARRRSFLIRPTRWGRVPVWPAGNVSRPAPPAPSLPPAARTPGHRSNRSIRSVRTAVSGAR